MKHRLLALITFGALSTFSAFAFWDFPVVRAATPKSIAILEESSESMALESVPIQQKRSGDVESVRQETPLLRKIGNQNVFFLLLGGEDWIPNETRARRWVSEICPEVDFDSVWTPEAKRIFEECCKHWALRQFVLEYEDRERRRWEAGEVSIPLEVELFPVYDLLDEFGIEIHNLISAYSNEVIDSIRENGTDEVSVDSRWDLFSKLTEAKAFKQLKETVCND